MKKIIRLVNEDCLTLREISKKFNLTKDICSIFNENICASLAFRQTYGYYQIRRNSNVSTLCSWKTSIILKRAKGDKFNN